MKLFKKLRKGFTLIELVVVIAVIAILTAVSIVSYVSITNKAKTSADQQAVTQMNTILKANDILGLKTIKDVYAAFEESDLDGNNYKPLAKDTYFFWDQDKNQILYTDKNYTVLFPKEFKGEKKNDNSRWISLSGEIEKRDYSAEIHADGGTITGNAIQAGEKLYTLSEDVASGNQIMSTDTQKTIELPKEVDLAGAEFKLGTAKNLTIKGAEAEPTVIENVFASESQSYGTASNRLSREYKVGMVQTVKGTVTFENLVIENVTIGDYGISMAAIFAGQIVDGGKLVVKNCKIKNAYIYGEQKVATLAGHVSNGSVEVSGCTFENVHIMAEEGVAGGLVGLVGKGDSNKLICDASSADSCKKNVSCELKEVADRHYYEAPVAAEFKDASNKVVSTFESYSSRKPETVKVDGVDRERCKPGCATFAWKQGDALNPVGKSYSVAYGLNPIHF